MGMFRRLNTVLRSNLSALLDRAEDPEKLIAQTALDMRGELKTARRELVSALGTAKRLAKEREDLLEEARRWEERATLALREGDEDLAREALRQRARAQRQADEVGARASRQEAAADEMRVALERVEQRIGDLESRGHTLAAEVRRARQAGTREAAPGARFGSQTFDDLERMGSRIDQLEAEVEAADVLDDTRRAEVARRFRELEREAEADGVEDQLAELKKKLDGGV
jgi:phage shock protein A